MDHFQSSQFPDSEGLLGSWPALTTTPSFTSLATTDEIFEPLFTGPKCLTSNVQFSNDFEFCNQDAIIDCPPMWGDAFTSLKSQAPPSTLFWEAAHPQTISATTNEPLDFSPNLLPLRYAQKRQRFGGYVSNMSSNGAVRKQKPRQTEVASDLAATSRHHRSIATSQMPESENTFRDHPLYQNVAPKGDGLYHCPWEGQEDCQHKPVKLKSEYRYGRIQLPSPRFLY